MEGVANPPGPMRPAMEGTVRRVARGNHADPAAGRSRQHDGGIGGEKRAKRRRVGRRQRPRSSEQSALAAEAAAAAAKGIVELGKRAWVHATEFKLSLKTQSNENSTLEIWIANLGSTPAREVKLSSNFLICDEIPQDLPSKPRVNNVVLGPSVSFSLSHFLRVSPADLASISTGRKLMLTCGQAQYRDVWGLARETRWCAVYDYTAKAFVPTPANNSTT